MRIGRNGRYTPWTMSASVVCGVCGTVNVTPAGACIACGQPLPAESADGKTVAMEPQSLKAAPEAPVRTSAPARAPTPATAPPPAPAAAPTAAPPAAPPAPAAAPEREVRAARAASAPTTPLSAAATAQIRDADLESIMGPPLPTGERTVPSMVPERIVPDASTYIVRLLLPEGDKRVVEIGTEPVRLGSGLDEVGLAGDPRVGPGEATLTVHDGRLWLDVAETACGVYRRIETEETLRDGDVVLFGDIAAEFRASPRLAPVAPEPHVLGGATGSPCGRLLFLRRDGTPGSVHDLPAGKTIVGRTDGHLNFPTDSRLSRRHVRFHASEEGVTVEDLDSRNGTYLRVRGRRRVDVGDALRVGSAGLQIRSRE